MYMFKNEEEIARNGLNNCNGILKEEDFTIIKANWDEKYKNIKDICEEINLLPESMVFLDDNEMERDSVETFIPEIKTLVLSDPMYYRKVLDQGGYFESVGFTEDDKHRTEFYKANMERENSKTLFDNYNDYLSSLEMKASISSFSEKNIVRVTQLINKTNQFNLTGVGYTQSELETISYSENHITLCSRLTDRFGDNGIVTSIVGEISNPKELTITSWVMSCRVFKRNPEHMMFDLLVEQCRIKGIKRILGIYINTGKNKPANDFYNELGFSKYICSDEKTQWEYIIPENYKKMNQVIEVLKMNEKDIMDIITTTIREVFDDESLVISESTGQNDIEEWDSLAQIRIILLLEREFGIKFDVEKVGTYSTVGDIFNAVKHLIDGR